MSKFIADDKHWLMGCTPSQRALNPMEKALVLTTWDSETDNDEKNIAANIVKIKIIKKLCAVKLAMFVPELLLTIPLLGKKRARMLTTCAWLYFRFLTGKLNLVDFNKSLMFVTKESIII